MTTTNGLDLVELYVAAAESFAVALASCDMRASVPACPRWSTYDLAVHLGNVHAWAATIVETGRFAVEQNDEPRSRKPKAVSAWYAGKAEDLYEVLRGTAPNAPCWNFAFGDGDAAFWPRRQMHETSVHLVDLGAANRLVFDLDPALCADGVDEVLTVFLHRLHHRGYPAMLTAPLTLVATDADRAWTVTPRAVRPQPETGVPQQVRGSATETAPALIDGPPIVVERRHPSADRVEGPADALYRLLWKRLPVDDLDAAGVALVGDAARIRGFLSSPLVP